MTSLLTAPDEAPPAPADDARHARRALAVSTLMFVALSVAGAVSYKGFIEGDAANHYLIARFAVDRPENFASVWGRPLATLLYTLPAQVGRHSAPPDPRAGVLATRALSLGLALWIAFVAWRIARGMGLPRPELAALFCYAQPIFFTHSFAEMTEVPFAAVLAGAFWAYQRRRWFIMALLAGLLPLARPEGFGLVLLAGAALAWQRRWWWLPVLAVPFLAWNWAGWYLTLPRDGSPPGVPWYLWVKANWPYSARSAYGSGYPWDFIGRLPLLVGSVTFLFTLVGIPLLLREGGDEGRDGGDGHEAPDGEPKRRRRPLHVAFWAVTIPLLALVGHTVLWCGGWMGSMGGMRYLVICTPFWAILTLRGWNWAWERYGGYLPPRLRHGYTIAVLASFVPFFSVFTGLSYPNLLPGTDPVDVVTLRIADWWRSDPELSRRYPRILSSLPTLSYHLDRDLSRPEHSAEPGKSGLRRRTPGTMLIWDPKLGATNSDRNLCLSLEEIRAAGWVHVRHVSSGEGGGATAEVFLSPTDIEGRPTASGVSR